jgi:hypothetical protein
MDCSFTDRPEAIRAVTGAERVLPEHKAVSSSQAGDDDRRGAHDRV